MNPPDVPGYTQMYTFGIKVNSDTYTEYCVMTVRAATEEQAKRHIQAIFEGRYSFAALMLFTDMGEWKQEAKPDEVSSGH